MSRLHVRLATLDGWADPMRTALAAAGVQVAAHHDIGLALSPGRVVPSAVDRWMTSSRPHLLVALRPGTAEVGPWVAPGATACARCVEAGTLDVADPAFAPDLDLGLTTLVAGWVARDLDRWSRGELPLTWGTSWLLGATAVPEARRWLRHPHCGCSWYESA
jgi:hypothetical protein